MYKKNLIKNGIIENIKKANKSGKNVNTIQVQYLFIIKDTRIR